MVSADRVTAYATGGAISLGGVFSKLEPSSRFDLGPVKQHLLRGYLTLKLIQDVRVDQHPDLAMTSALWLPVQTYYAVHGFGIAFLAARHGTMGLPRSHRAFMNAVAERIVPGLLPAPFSAMLQGGYLDWEHLQPQVINISDDLMPLRPGLNLAAPDEVTRETHILQCLDTTRRRLINDKLEQERRRAKKPGKRHGVLRKPQQIQIANGVAPTTVFDYLYRVRIKSNYEDPAMFYADPDDAEALLELVRNTRKLAAMLCGFLVALVWQTIDEPSKNQLGEEIDIDDLLQAIDK